MVLGRAVGTAAADAGDRNCRATAGGRNQAAGRNPNTVVQGTIAIQATGRASYGHQAAGRSDFGSGVACAQCIEVHTIVGAGIARAKPAACAVDRDRSRAGG